MKRRRATILLSYAAAPLLVALITWALAGMQSWLIGHPGFGSPRAYTTLFFGGIALVTWLGGRGPGLWTLGLSLVFTAYFVMLPKQTLAGKSVADMLQLALFLGLGAMIIEGVEALVGNRRLLARSEEAQARLRAVMDTAPVGVVLSELNGTVSYANQEAERIWGHSLRRGKSENQRSHRILDPDGRPTPPEQKTLARVLAGEAPALHREHLVEQPDGTRLWVESAATLVVDGGGSPLGALAVISDITGRKEADLALRARRALPIAGAECQRYYHCAGRRRHSALQKPFGRAHHGLSSQRDCGAANF